MDNALQYWHQLVASFPGSQSSKDRLGREVVANYQAKGRHYHTLAHIGAMLALWEQHRAQLADAQAVGLAIWFHDAVYQPTRKDNEEQSAQLARVQLTELGAGEPLINKVEQYILATKRHELAAPDPDLAYLLDFDLAALAGDEASYRQYAQQVRREYGIYPDLLYVPGRKKVLEALLGRDRLFHQLGETYEVAARRNLRAELAGQFK
jgi:predicted metal-dependent HD superfamily phosphohydrolase